MSIIQFTPAYPAGQVDVKPGRAKLVTTDNLATITTAGYLNQAITGQINPTDFIDVVYSYNVATGAGTMGVFTASISNGIVTLVPLVSYGNVLLPVTSGHIANFNGTTGQIQDAGIASNVLALSTVTSPDAQSDIIWYDITASAAALATAGKVNVQVSSGTKQYIVRNIRVVTSTGLSGGGGDRLLSLTDGTHAFNATGITAAVLGTPVNTVWGGTGNPLPTIALNTPSTAGANIYLQYIGGTTDYTLGSVIISVCVQRVA